jgi:hypothetical protein
MNDDPEERLEARFISKGFAIPASRGIHPWQAARSMRIGMQLVDPKKPAD